MIIDERDSRKDFILNIAKQMMTAARTAPKGKGIDIIEIITVTGDDITALSDKMIAMVEEHGMKFFYRDADNILSADAIVVIGSKEMAQGLNCGYCGYDTCDARAKNVPCAINVTDLGIAIGSACSTAMDLKVDTRVMFSAGLAVKELDWMPGCNQIYAIPISASSKNPFFDRKPKEQQSNAK